MKNKEDFAFSLYSTTLQARNSKQSTFETRFRHQVKAAVLCYSLFEDCFSDGIPLIRIHRALALNSMIKYPPLALAFRYQSNQSQL